LRKQRLDEGLRLGRKLTLISAPAGFGKTTLVTEWLYGKDREVSSRSIAQLSLDEVDNDPFSNALVGRVPSARTFEPADDLNH
jgi:LuxR family maltose regulon positive regulatory protein